MTAASTRTSACSDGESGGSGGLADVTGPPSAQQCGGGRLGRLWRRTRHADQRDRRRGVRDRRERGDSGCGTTAALVRGVRSDGSSPPSRSGACMRLGTSCADALGRPLTDYHRCVATADDLGSSDDDRFPRSILHKIATKSTQITRRVRSRELGRQHGETHDVPHDAGTLLETRLNSERKPAPGVGSGLIGCCLGLHGKVDSMIAPVARFWSFGGQDG